MIHFTQMLVLTTLFSFSAFTNGNDQLPCRAVSKREVSKQARTYGTDPASIVRKATSVLHNQFKAHSKGSPNQIFRDEGDLRIQMSILYNYFALGNWTNKITDIKEASELDSFTSSELDYAFTQWLRTRYLSSVRELVRERELASVFRDRIQPAIKSRVIDNPAELMITGYEDFQCESHWDKKAYNCSQTHVMVTAQLSPYTMCRDNQRAKQSEFRYLVNVSDTKFRITDVEYAGKRLFQDALIDLTSMLNSKKNPKGVIETLKLWSYTKPFPTQKEQLQAFQEQLFRKSKIQQKSSRMPASE